MKNTTHTYRGRAALMAWRKASGTALDESDLRDCITDLLHLHASLVRKLRGDEYDTETMAMIAIRAWKAEQ